METFRSSRTSISIGPSGCGKSTALRMIAGLEEITGGAVSIGGRVVNDLPPKDRDIAMVFQSYALYPHMTVRENMEFGLRMRAIAAEIQRRVGFAAEILGLGPSRPRGIDACARAYRTTPRSMIGERRSRRPRFSSF